MVVLLGYSLAGAGLMNETAQIFFLLRSARDREWPIAINVDQPKLLPQQQSDRVWRTGGTEIVSVCCARPCCFANERQRKRVNGARGRRASCSGGRK